MSIRYIIGLLLCMPCITYLSAMEHSFEDGEPHKQVINSQRITADIPHNKSITSLLYNKLKRDFSYLAPHAIRLGALVGVGYGIYQCIASTTGVDHLTNYTVNDDC